MQRFTKFELLMGLNDKDTKVQEVNTLEAYKVVRNLACQTFDGATIYEAEGSYKHEDGIIVFEKTLKIEVILFDKNKGENEVKAFVNTLKTLFNQESIAVQKSFVTSDLW